MFGGIVSALHSSSILALQDAACVQWNVLLPSMLFRIMEEMEKRCGGDAACCPDFVLYFRSSCDSGLIHNDPRKALNAKSAGPSTPRSADGV